MHIAPLQRGIALTLLALGAYPVHAEDTPKSFGFELGTYAFSAQTARRVAQDTGFIVGARYHVPSLDKKGLVSADLLFQAGNGSGNTLETIGLYYSDRIFLNAGANSTTRPYYGASVGVAQTRLKTTASPVGEGAVFTTVTRKTGLAGRLILGAQLPGYRFVELGYNLNSKIFDIQTNTIGLTIGQSF